MREEERGGSREEEEVTEFLAVPVKVEQQVAEGLKTLFAWTLKGSNEAFEGSRETLGGSRLEEIIDTPAGETVVIESLIIVEGRRVTGTEGGGKE